ncbi:MAG: integrin alpha, partial [Actinomycetota bacterium]
KISDTAGGFTATLDDDDQFGLGLAGIGDLDGDGVRDMVAGASDDDDGGGNAGALYVLFLNADGTVKAEQKISATTTPALASFLEGGDEFGSEATPIGDLDLDGIVDLAVSAPYDDDGANWAGAVYILFLNDDGTVRAADKISATSGGLTGPLDSFDYFGFGLAALGDLDGDGTINLAAGAFGDDDGASSAGAVYILDLVDGCTLGTGYGSACPFSTLAEVPDDADGRFWFDFGGGAFQASVSSDEGGSWVQVLQYNHEGGTNPNLDVRTAGESWPAFSAAPNGTDQSGTSFWGHTGQAAASAIPDAAADLELRWQAETSNHGRVIHFRSPVIGEFQTDTADDFFVGGIATGHALLSGHTANLPASTTHAYSDQGDDVLTDFPIYRNGTYHWGIRGTGSRWEVDDLTSDANSDTLHRMWVRVAPTAVTVNSTGDGADTNAGDGICSTGGTIADGTTECTLRAAIEEANASARIDTIEFDIPNSDPNHLYQQDDSVADSLSTPVVTTLDDASITDFDPDYPVNPFSWWNIQVTGNLPDVSGGTTIDGTTQPGWQPNTATGASPTDAILPIVITSDGSYIMDLRGSGSTVRGLNLSGTNSS